MERPFLFFSLIFIFFASFVFASDLKKVSDYPKGADRTICEMAVPKIMKKRYSHIPIFDNQGGDRFVKIYLTEFKKCMDTRKCYSMPECTAKGDYKDDNISKLMGFRSSK